MASVDAHTFRTDPDFWYLVGASEDVYLNVDSETGNYEFDLDSASERWLQQIQPIIKKIVQKDVKIRKHTNRDHHRLRFWNKALVCELKAIKDAPEQVSGVSKEFQRQWLAGFFDAEGSVQLSGYKQSQPMLSIYSTSGAKIDIIIDLLGQQFGIRAGKYLPKDRNVWQLFITGRGSVATFATEIPLRHPEKRESLARILQA